MNTRQLATQFVSQDGTRAFLRESNPRAKLPAPGRCVVVCYPCATSFYEVSKTLHTDERGKPVYEVKTLEVAR